MNITLHNLGRRFNQEWVFRHVDYIFSSNQKYAILGPNGSGKSTFIKCLTGQLTASEGELRFSLDGITIDEDNIYQHVAVAAPYIELIEEFTLNEFLNFHFKFKKILPGFDLTSMVALLGMEKSLNKEIKYFSSGMKQRVKLGIACCSTAELLFLDEPTSNLDVEGEAWYLDLLKRTIMPNRTLIVGSNQEKEYYFCDEFIRIQDYK